MTTNDDDDDVVIDSMTMMIMPNVIEILMSFKWRIGPYH